MNKWIIIIFMVMVGMLSSTNLVYGKGVAPTDKLIVFLPMNESTARLADDFALEDGANNSVDWQNVDTQVGYSNRSGIFGLNFNGTGDSPNNMPRFRNNVSTMDHNLGADLAVSMILHTFGVGDKSGGEKGIIKINNNGLTMQLNDKGNLSARVMSNALQTGIQLDNGSYIHWTITYDNSMNEFLYYINATLVNNLSQTNDEAQTVNNAILGSIDFNVDVFNGSMSHFRLYNRTLTSQEVSSIFDDDMNVSAAAPPPSDTCTPPGSGNWDITCDDACIFTTNQNVPGNITLTGSGEIKLQSSFTFTGSNQYINIASGCTLACDSGAQFLEG